MNAPRSDATGRSLRLARKELREILRDRRTVFTLILMPLLVYPLLGAVMSKGVLSALSDGAKVEVHVVVRTDNEQVIFAQSLYHGEQLLNKSAGNVEPESLERLTFESTPGLVLQLYSLEHQEGDETLESLVRSGRADVGVAVSQTVPGAVAPRGTHYMFLDWRIVQRDGSALSKRGYEEINRRLQAANENNINQLEQAGLIPKVRPSAVSRQLVKLTGTSQASPLVTFIPLVLVLMTMTGAVYPAIDLTAGERERGTMEILVAAPVPRLNLLAGKFVAVLTVALLTATMNLLSMFLTLFALGLEGTILGSISATMVFQIVVLMMVFAAFFSSVLLSVTSIARSFKEAQAYLIPLMLISLTPGIFALLPDIEINGPLAVAPLINVVLMGRDLLQGNVNVLMFAIVLISTALYGVLALSLAARVFGSDAVLYGSSGTWSDLLRRPKEPRDTAPMAVSTSCLACLFSLFIILGPLGGRLGLNIGQQLIANAVVLVALFALIPLGFAAVSRVNIRSGFTIAKARLRWWVVAVLLGVSVWPFLYELEIMMISEERIAFLMKLAGQFDLGSVSLPLKILCLAAAPAICEEFFFRGFLQNSIRQNSSAAMAVVSAALLFGLFHVIVKDVLFFERLIPSTLMGIVLGMVYERSGSVLPGMLLHLIHNSLLMALSHYQDVLERWGGDMENRTHLPSTWLVSFGVVALVAAFLLWKQPPEAERPGND